MVGWFATEINLDGGSAANPDPYIPGKRKAVLYEIVECCVVRVDVWSVRTQSDCTDGIGVCASVSDRGCGTSIKSG